MRLRLQVTDDAASLNRDHNGLEVYQTVPSLSMSFKDYNDFKTKADVDAVDAELSKIDSKVIPYRRNRMVFFHSDLWHRTDGTAPSSPAGQLASGRSGGHGRRGSCRRPRRD